MGVEALLLAVGAGLGRGAHAVGGGGREAVWQGLGKEGLEADAGAQVVLALQLCATN